MMSSKNALFERLRLQTHLRTLITELGEDHALEIIRSAIEVEMRRQDRERDSTEHIDHSLRK